MSTLRKVSVNSILTCDCPSPPYDPFSLVSKLVILAGALLLSSSFYVLSDRSRSFPKADYETPLPPSLYIYACISLTLCIERYSSSWLLADLLTDWIRVSVNATLGVLP